MKVSSIKENNDDGDAGESYIIGVKSYFTPINK